MERITLVIDGTGFVLGDGSDVTELKDRIAHAARTGPAFVDFATIDGAASALVGPATRVVLTTESATEAEFEPEEFPDTSLAWTLDFGADASLGWDEPFEAHPPQVPRLRAVGGRGDGRSEANGTRLSGPQ